MGTCTSFEAQLHMIPCAHHLLMDRAVIAHDVLAQAESVLQVPATH